MVLAFLCTGCDTADNLLTTQKVGVNPTTGLVATNIVANPSIQAATALVSLAPFPFAGLVSTILAGGLGLYAQIRNRKARAQLSSQEQVLEAVIGGVELAGEAAKEVKKVISKSAQARGVTSELHARVKKGGG